MFQITCQMTSGLHRGGFLLFVALLALAAGVGFPTDPARASTQGEPAPAKDSDLVDNTRQQALEKIQYLVGLVGVLPDPAQRILGHAVVGQALIFEDREAGRSQFRQAFNLLETLAKKEKKERTPDMPAADQSLDARVRELRADLFSRIQQVDPTFLRELTESKSEERAEAESENASEEKPRKIQRANARGALRRAQQELAADPAKAAALAEQSLAFGVPQGLSYFLVQLRQEDQALADQLYESAFAAATRVFPPSPIEIFELASYVFPSLAQGRWARPPDSSRARRFLEMVAMSVTQSTWQDSVVGNERAYNQLARHYMAFQQLLPQFQIYAPDLLEDLSQITDQVMSSVPDRVRGKLSTAGNPTDPVEVLKRQAEDETSPAVRDDIYAQAALVAASRDDSGEARQLIQRIQNADLRQKMGQEVTLIAAQLALGKRQWGEFHQLIQQIQDLHTRADLLIKGADDLIDRNKPDMAKDYLAEATQVLAPLSPSRRQAFLLFAAAASHVKAGSLQGFESGQAAVSVLNKLEMAKKESQKKPTNIFAVSDHRETLQILEAAFRSLSRVDFSRAIEIANQLQDIEQKLAAQASGCREILSRASHSRKESETRKPSQLK